MSDDAIKLRQIRNRLALLGQSQWLVAVSGADTFVEAKTATDTIIVAQFSRAASPDEIEFFVNAPTDLAFMVRLIDRAIEAARNRSPAPQQNRQRDPKDFAAEAAMKCEEPAFKAFLEDRHGLDRPLTTERVAQKLRTVLCVSSRKELNNDEAAADRWRKLRADFETWRKASR